MNLDQFSPVRFARVVALSIIYMLLVLLIWNHLAEWMISHASASKLSADNLNSLRQFRLLFVLGNSLAFAAALLWLARTRTFSPLGRYLIPTTLAVCITFVIALVVMIAEAIPSPGEFVATKAGILFYWMDSVIPGLLSAQLFRLPRHRVGVPAAEIQGSEAV
jgi:hypothetical protein